MEFSDLAIYKTIKPNMSKVEILHYKKTPHSAGFLFNLNID